MSEGGSSWDGTLMSREDSVSSQIKQVSEKEIFMPSGFGKSPSKAPISRFKKKALDEKLEQVKIYRAQFVSDNSLQSWKPEKR